MRWAFLVVGLTLFCTTADAQMAPLAIASDATSGQSYSLSIQILVLMTLLTLLPAAILSTSAFVRIIIVLSILRQALGTAQTPPNQVLLGIALFLTFFVMSPVISDIHENAATPYIDGQITAGEAMSKGISVGCTSSAKFTSTLSYSSRIGFQRAAKSSKPLLR